MRVGGGGGRHPFPRASRAPEGAGAHRVSTIEPPLTGGNPRGPQGIKSSGRSRGVKQGGFLVSKTVQRRSQNRPRTSSFPSTRRIGCLPPPPSPNTRTHPLPHTLPLTHTRTRTHVSGGARLLGGGSGAASAAVEIRGERRLIDSLTALLS